MDGMLEAAAQAAYNSAGYADSRLRDQSRGDDDRVSPGTFIYTKPSTPQLPGGSFGFYFRGRGRPSTDNVSMLGQRRRLAEHDKIKREGAQRALLAFQEACCEGVPRPRRSSSRLHREIALSLTALGWFSTHEV